MLYLLAASRLHLHVLFDCAVSINKYYSSHILKQLQITPAVIVIASPSVETFRRDQGEAISHEVC